MLKAIIIISMLIITVAFAVQENTTEVMNPQISGIELSIPKSINFQGYLYRDGTPMDTTMNIWFGIYTALSGGSLLYQITRSNVIITDGWFTVTLDNIPNSVFPVSGPTRYLEVKAPSTGPALEPRLSLVSVGYSYHSIISDTAEYANAGRPTSSAGGDLSGVYPNPTVDGLWGRSIASTAPGTNQVLKWTGSQWAPRNDSIGGGIPDSIPGNLAVGGELRVHSKARLGYSCYNNGFAAFCAGYGNSASGDRASVTGGEDNSASGKYSHVSGGSENIVNALWATISGGNVNEATDTAATVAGGQNNFANGRFSVVSGGGSNRARGRYSTVGGGRLNIADSAYASVCGGIGNEAYRSCSYIGGGEGNKVRGKTGGVVAGLYNYADGFAAFVGAGNANNADSSYTAIVGGHTNDALAQGAFVGGGGHNYTNGLYSTVSGGHQNTVSGYYATISGGKANNCAGDSGTVSGGGRNRADSVSATVGGGTGNQAGRWATVAGGRSNLALGYCASIGGGYSHNATDNYATVAGGYNHDADGHYSFIGGGSTNQADSGYCFIGGGSANRARGGWATVGGGWANDASGYRSVVAGGHYNTAGHSYTFVGGGYGNNISRPYAVIAGGSDNVADGGHSAIGGGRENSITEDYGTIAGGWDNIAFHSAVVAGGYLNNAAGQWSAVVGGIGSYAGMASVAGGYADSALASYSFAVGNKSVVPSSYTNSAAFNGMRATSASQLRCGTISKTGGSFTIDHPIDPYGKILNHYFVESPEMINIYRGMVQLDENGKAEVNLPEYFDALNRNPMIQLTGVGTYEVFVAEKIKANRFIIGGKPGTEVYWTVTGDRKDQSAEVIRTLMPVEQTKKGELTGCMLDDDFLAGTMEQLEREGKAANFKFRTAAGQKRYEDMKRIANKRELIRDNESKNK